VHAGAIPVKVNTERFAMVFNVNGILLTETLKEVASHPDIIGALLGALAEDLELPLAFGHFCIDAFVVDASVKAEVEMFLNDLASNVTDVLVADAGIVRALRCWVATIGETERATVLIEEILLFKTEPSARVINDRSAAVGWVCVTVWQHDLAHDENAILAGGIRIHGHWLEHAVGLVTGCLACGGAIETPEWEFFQRREGSVFLDLGLAAEVWHGCVTVEPDVFEFILRHRCVWLNVGLVDVRRCQSSRPELPIQDFCSLALQSNQLSRCCANFNGCWLATPARLVNVL
jgi:hypothetical protein